MAHEFEIPEMEAKALEAFRRFFEDVGPDVVVDMLEDYGKYGYSSRELVKTVQDVRDKHKQAIIEDPLLALNSNDQYLMEESLYYMAHLPKKAMECEDCGACATLHIKVGGDRCDETSTKKCKWVETAKNSGSV